MRPLNIQHISSNDRVIDKLVHAAPLAIVGLAKMINAKYLTMDAYPSVVLTDPQLIIGHSGETFNYMCVGASLGRNKCGMSRRGGQLQ